MAVASGLCCAQCVIASAILGDIPERPRERGASELLLDPSKLDPELRVIDPVKAVRVDDDRIWPDFENVLRHYPLIESLLSAIAERV